MAILYGQLCFDSQGLFGVSSSGEVWRTGQEGLVPLGIRAQAEVWKEQGGKPNLRGHRETRQWERGWGGPGGKRSWGPSSVCREQRARRPDNSDPTFCGSHAKGASGETSCLQKT